MEQHWIPHFVDEKGRCLDVYSSLLTDDIIFINSPINQRVAGLINTCLLYITSKLGRNHPQLYINTRGGDLIAALSTLDVIEYYKRQNLVVETVGFGEIGIAPLILLMAGTEEKRILANNAQISLYMGLESLELVNMQGAQAKSKQSELLKAKVQQIISQYSKFNIEELRFRTENEAFISAEEALKFGLVDKIL